MKMIMKNTKNLVRPGPQAILSVLLCCALAGCGAKKDAGANPDSNPDGLNAVPVEVAVAGLRHLSITKTYSGPLEGEEQANVIARLSERVAGVQARVGETVGSGQILVTLDKGGPSSQYYQAEAGFRNSEKTLERMKSLYKEGAVSLQSLDGAQTAFDVAKANFDAARGTVELAAPIAGVVAFVNVNEGDLTSPGAVLATIAKIRRMKAIFNVNEGDVANLSIGQTIRVYSETRPDVKVDGEVTQISRSADTRSRSFEIKALFPNTADRWFKPGMFCRVTLEIAPRGKLLVIPNAAIQSDGGADRVFVIRSGRAFLRIVRAGLTDGQTTEILQGLNDRDTVATIGLNNLRDSSLVSVVRK
jgi:membrane fusion protein (multidrug efflux system)